MDKIKNGILLRVLIGEADRLHNVPLYEQIVIKARELNLAGATVLRGVMGFGANSIIKSTKILRLSEDLPVIIEIVDSKENIEKILPFLYENVKEGLVTQEKADVLIYRSSGS